MKHIMTLKVEKGFDWESERYICAQVDNLLRLRVPVEDILFITNFDFLYRNVHTVKVPELDEHRRYFEYKYIALKAAKRLRMINEITWLHDLDVWQNYAFSEKPPFRDMGGVLQKSWINGGSLFIRFTGFDLMDSITDMVIGKDGSDEPRITKIARKNSDRFDVLNPTWNLGTSYFHQRLSLADKPVMVLHFHPEKNKHNISKQCSPQLFEIIKRYWG